MPAVLILLFAASPFVLQLAVGELMFARFFQKRDRFYLRLAFSLGAELLLGTAIYAICATSPFWLIQNTLCYLLLFLICLLLPFLCYKEPPISLILCAVSGYMVQHIGAQVFQMFWNGQDAFAAKSLKTILLFQLCNFLVFGVTAALIFFSMVRGVTHAVLSESVRWQLFFLSLTTLAVVLVLSSVRDAFAGESFALMVVSRMFSIFCCMFLLYLRLVILERDRMEQERENLLRLHAVEREQYEQSRENIELINIKCHDLKRRMERWENGPVDQDEIRQVREIVGIYDSAVKTGNETIDVLLTERSLYCERHGIRLSCMIDGEKLSFMSVGDICALFGNALENAIEAVSRLEDPADRNISFLVREYRGMLVVTVDNCYQGPLTFKDGLPCTIKEEGVGYHGYGLKSIRWVAEKYGGQATVVADDLFHLNVLIPFPEAEN